MAVARKAARRHFFAHDYKQAVSDVQLKRHCAQSTFSLPICSAWCGALSSIIFENFIQHDHEFQQLCVPDVQNSDLCTVIRLPSRTLRNVARAIREGKCGLRSTRIVMNTVLIALDAFDRMNALELLAQQSMHDGLAPHAEPPFSKTETERGSAPWYSGSYDASPRSAQDAAH